MFLIFGDSTLLFQSSDYLCRKQKDMEAHTVLLGGPVRDGGYEINSENSQFYFDAWKRKRLL